MRYLFTYLLTIPVFFGIDMIWLGVIAQKLYQRELKAFLSSQVNWVAAIIFYLLFIVGVLYFAVMPGVEKKSLSLVLINAALFGLFTYATYDLTNLATLKNWPITIVVIDIVWGMVLSMITALAAYLIYQRLG